MLTRVVVRRFKRFAELEVELGPAVVLVGPNNSGKTSLLQALALWEAGLRKWLERRGTEIPTKRPGVTLNRRDLVSLPVPTAKALWQDLHVREVARDAEGRQRTSNLFVEIEVRGVTEGRAWTCGLEFDYANEESLYCRPLAGRDGSGRMPVPEEAGRVRLAFLPPMSGLAAQEVKLEAGAVAVRVGEGRTAEVLRNLCHSLSVSEVDRGAWPEVARRVGSLFGVEFDPPRYVAERGEVAMTYRDSRGIRLDLSSAGRGLHQTLLLLAYLHTHRGAVLLLDEPDAHLEILRQRQIYDLLTEATAAHGGQLIVATHSEVLLNEAADRDVVVAFVGRPHRIDDRGSQVAKALKEIGFEAYYQAEQRGWILYLEGSTDLALLRGLARILDHPAAGLLEAPFVHYVGNHPPAARSHFFALAEAKPDFVGLALFDRLDREVGDHEALRQAAWRRSEIENYVTSIAVLARWAEQEAREASPGPLFDEPEVARRREAMERAIEDLIPRIAREDPADRWWAEEKASALLDRLFERYYRLLGLENLMRKTDYHRLVAHVRSEEVDPEVGEILDRIAEVAGRARTAAE